MQIWQSRGRLDELRAALPAGCELATPDDLALLDRWLASGSDASTEHVIAMAPAYHRLFPELLDAVLARQNALRSGTASRPAAKAGTPASAAASSIDAATGAHFLRQWTRNACVRLRPDSARMRLHSGSARMRLHSDSARMRFVASLPRAANAQIIDDDSDSPTALLYCGASPTLYEDLGVDETTLFPAPDYTPGYLKKYYTVAADTALAPLLAAGILPDLVISIDSGRGTYFHLQAARRVWDTVQRRGLHRFAEDALAPFDTAPRLPGTVFTMLAGHRSLEGSFARCIYYRTSQPFDQWLGAGPLAAAAEWRNPGRNAVGLALQWAACVGFRSMHTAGAGLIARGATTHIRGTGYSEYRRALTHRRSTLSGYLPPGYGARQSLRDGRQPARTAKNAESQAALEQMAGELQIRLAGTPNPHSCRERLASQARQSDPTFEPASLEVTARDLYRFIASTRGQLDTSVFANFGIAGSDLDRWLGL